MMIVDFHSHILPNVDDGSASVEKSVEMLELEAQQGIQHVIATPHFYPQHDDPKRFLARREEAFSRLQEKIADRTDLPKVTVGAEVYFFHGISECDFLPHLTIGGKNCILIEMVGSVWSDRMYRELRDIREKQDLIPIIAHIDRYITPVNASGVLARLEELPVFVQANAEPFLHFSTRGMLLRGLRADQIHLLGSDCHDTASRKPNLADAVKVIEKRLGREALEQICRYQQMLLD